MKSPNNKLEPKLKEKRWNVAEEERLIELWEKEDLYSPDKYGDPNKIIVIDTPPPYTSGRWHVGAAGSYAQIDMVARYFRMKGYRVIVPWYADRNGLPVEILVERETGINPHEIAKTPEGRAKFLNLCRERLDRVEREMVEIWKRLGCSFEYWRNGTDSESYRKLTQATFIELWKKGLIYEDERPVFWCPRCMTSLAEAELEYVEKGAKMYHIRIDFRNGESGTIATTRPELIGAMVAISYNPEDKRYTKLEGTTGIVPVYGYEVPVKPHREVDPEYGTGLMMICSYGDSRDIRIIRDLKLPTRIIIDKDGRINDLGGPLKSLKIDEARRRIVEILEREGYIVKVENISSHRIPVCWRCKTPIEIIHSKELFLKQLIFIDDLMRIAKSIDFKPEFHRIKLIDWINSLRMDWPISKTRYYATEVPLWRCRSCNEYLVPEPGRYYRPWIDEPPFEKCPRCGTGKEHIEGDKRVFDTWFDSSISALYVSRWGSDKEFFSKAFGNILRPQGYEIIRTWLYYTLLRVYQLTGKPAFRWVRINGMGLDHKGEAMHKSKGNVIDPEPVMRKYGADALRYWTAAAAKLGYDYRFKEELIRTGNLFATKLWNIARFVSMFPKPSGGFVLTDLDKAILKKLSRAIEIIDRNYSELDVYTPIHEIYRFAWDIFASHYIEAVKPRVYRSSSEYSDEEVKGAWWVLNEVLSNILRMLAPIMPFITDAIWRQLYGRTIHKESFPETYGEWREYDEKPLDLLIKINSAVWKYKKENGLRLSQELNAVLYIDDQAAESIVREIKALHRISKVAIGKPKDSEANIIRLAENLYLSPIS